MKLPNKFRDYEHSTIHYFPIVLRIIRDNNLTLKQLRRHDSIKGIPLNDLAEVLDCLFFLNKIKILSGGVLVYVEETNVW